MTDPTTQAAVERLAKVAAGMAMATIYPSREPYRVDLRTLLADHTRQAERIKELEGALKPFAGIADRYPTGGLQADIQNRSPDVIQRLHAAYFYQAAEALSATPPAAPSLPADVVELVKGWAKEAREEIDAHNEWLIEHDEEPDPGMDWIEIHPNDLLKLEAALADRVSPAVAEQTEAEG